MAVLTERCKGYKTGWVLLLLGTGIFISGFATPNWSEFTYEVKSISFKLRGHAGLWVTCYKGLYGESLCVGAQQSRGWELAVKGLEGTSMGILALSVFFAFYINCMAKTITNNRLLEVGTGLAAGLGISGVVVYATKLNQDLDFLGNVLPTSHDLDFNLSWSFGLAIGGLGVVLIASILLSVFNKPRQQPPLPNTTFSNLNGGYVNPAAAGTAMPPQGMVNVYATPGTVGYTAPPPHYYSGLTVQGQGMGQGYAVGQGQVVGQASAPMVFDTPVGVQKQ